MPRINVPYGDGRVGWFNDDQAEQVEGRREWDGSNMADVHAGANRWQTLYRTKRGQYVLRRESAWQTEQTTYEFVSDEDARDWLLRNESDEEVERWFGEIEEEKGPGRPEIGPAIRVRLGEELTARVDAARVDGESRAAAIRRLLTAALA
jgi:hypothetical protein